MKNLFCIIFVYQYLSTQGSVPYVDEALKAQKLGTIPSLGTTSSQKASSKAIAHQEDTKFQLQVMC